MAALTYGSFPQGTADEHSDIEFWLFAADDATVDGPAWLSAVGPLHHVVRNEFGAHVAFFPGLIRGEFHFATADDIAAVSSWPARGAPTQAMLVLDRTGELRAALDALPPAVPVPATSGPLCGRFANWLVLAHHVAERGELLRAADALAHAHEHLLWMVRLAEGRTRHWLTPSRRAEIDLPPAVVAALHQATGRADPASLTAVLAATWALGRAYWLRLADAEGTEVPRLLFDELDTTLGR